MSSHVGYQHIRRVKLQVAAIQKRMVLSGESVKYRDEDLRVINVINQIKEELGISGDIKVYGSRLHGMASGRSDLDITLLGDMAGASQQETLKDFQPEFEKYFDNVTYIGNTKVPLLKARDGLTGIQIDFCIGNHLAIQKSELLRAYCHCDERVCELGTNVKEWADARQLKGLHFLNSYTYMIMVVHYLQSCDPPVIPNLQAASVVTTRWVSHNSQSLDDLLVGFFEYFGWRFNWEVDAVCPRLNHAEAPIAKLALDIKVKPSQWYIEDPLEPDSFNNAKCTVWGQKQLRQEMQEAAINLREGRPWRSAYVPSLGFLQCRTKHNISEQAFLREFKECGITDVTSPRQPPGRDASVHLHFSDQECLQRALTKTGVCVEQCEMALHVVSSRLRRKASPASALLLETPPELTVLERLLNCTVSEGISANLNDGALRAGAPEFVPLGGVAHETGQLATGLTTDAIEFVPLDMCREMGQSATGSAGMGANAPELQPVSTCLEIGEPATGLACMDTHAPEFVPLRVAHETGQVAKGMASMALSMGFDAPEFVPLRMRHDTADSVTGLACTSVDSTEVGQNMTGLSGMVANVPEFVPVRMYHEMGEPATDPADIGANVLEFVPLRRRNETVKAASGLAGMAADAIEFVPLGVAGQNMTEFVGIGVDASEFAPQHMCHHIAKPAKVLVSMDADAPEFVPSRMCCETGEAPGPAGMGVDASAFLPLRMAHETGQSMTGSAAMGGDASEFAPLHRYHEKAEPATVPAAIGADPSKFVPLNMRSETRDATGPTGTGADATEFVPLRLAHETGQSMTEFVGMGAFAPEFGSLRVCQEIAERATVPAGMDADAPDFVPLRVCSELGEPTEFAGMGADALEFVPLRLAHETGHKMTGFVSMGVAASGIVPLRMGHAAGEHATGPAGIGAETPESVPLRLVHETEQNMSGVVGVGVGAPEFVPLCTCHETAELKTGLTSLGSDCPEYVPPCIVLETRELEKVPASMGADAPEFVPSRIRHDAGCLATGLAGMGANAPEFVPLSEVHGMGELATGLTSMDDDALELDPPLPMCHEMEELAAGHASMCADALGFVPKRMGHETRQHPKELADFYKSASMGYKLSSHYQPAADFSKSLQRIGGLQTLGNTSAPEFVPMPQWIGWLQTSENTNTKTKHPSTELADFYKSVGMGYKLSTQYQEPADFSKALPKIWWLQPRVNV